MMDNEKHYNFNFGLPMVGSCIRNNYYVPKWHKKDSKEHAPYPIQQIYRVVKNGSEQASEMKEETIS